jgi:cyclohexyl-isocyanide hydratase
MTANAKYPLMAVPADPNRPKTVGMLTFPGLTMLDLIGPHAVLNGPMETHLLWKDTSPIISDTGVSLHPTMRFGAAPEKFNVLFVPGGPGQVELFNDPEVMDFLALHGERADWVTSVCTGSMILGAAGLLDGYRAATHWAGREVLRLFGAEPVAERVVRDRNRITGGGVTAGIDFGLTLLQEIFDTETAETTQLLMEYDPAPPLNAGSIEQAGDDVAQKAMEVLALLHN